MGAFQLPDAPSLELSAASPPRPCDNKLLSILPAEDRARVAAQLSMVPLQFRQILYKQGEPIEDVYFPCGGACSLTKTMEDGRTAEIGTIGNEGMLGASVFFGDGLAQSDAIVQVAAKSGFKMAVQAFTDEMNRHGAFYDRVIRYQQALTIQVMQTTACNALHSAEQRCCRWLLMTRDRVGNDDLALTHEFLAIMLGVRRSTVSIIVEGLQKAGLVDTRRGQIKIVDRHRLEGSSCECYATVKANFARLLPDAAGFSGS